ncbi:hypothetical protein [Photobacterium iliopiscarium]|uniref:hypothetical protein n=1 Tax=Photobacterium iliopiscarium TaxID=56192 RepID=UPI001E537530|nr:hypothetical protein [Photobacterium iliopiscarium]MCD9489164.1 hypothetical protein [Photobacterium iliopiscarium]MCF2245838.1 hypothetical protein [Photobacterium iliopiscarium]
MTTSKTTDLSVKTQPATVELLTERLNAIQNKVDCLVEVISITTALQNCLHAINTNRDQKLGNVIPLIDLFDESDIESISKIVCNNINDVYSKLIALQDFTGGAR